MNIAFLRAPTREDQRDRHNNNVKEAETPQCEATRVLRELLFQQLCGAKSRRQCPKSNC